ncbi:DNA polymerase III subunit beta (plasmid) [Paenibacillus rhizovicinus]|uniref:DNA polymerase III subunit beta n=1 Tax=Paenibacillus rhizovicinus TaxID=2704463 RepID=A0A6C0PCE7_9BACL|nr:DNA polymerase III subunit beta [Paenibacillus rhizovicinus]QHW35543.1 DNA polymerase III subunit beta [Paenibacillus rhizovicinus]
MATATKEKNTKTTDKLENQLGTIATGSAAFSVERNDLLDALVLCSKIVPRSNSIPLLQCLKFDLKGDTLFITAMDMPKQAVLQHLSVTNDAGEDASYCLSAKEVIELVKRMPDGNLSFKQQDSTVTLNYGERGRANLKALNSEQYPELPQPGNASFLSCPIEMLRKGAHASRFAGSDENQPAITAVNLYNDEGKLGFVSTNRHRVYRYISDIKIENSEAFREGMIVAVQFKGIIDSLKSPIVGLAITNDYLVLRDKNVVYFGRLLDGAYPNILNVFAKIGEGSALTVSREMLDDTLNRMLSLVGVENNRVTLEVNESGEFTVHSRSETGEICESFPDAKVEDGFPTIKFNGMYLRDALLVGDREVKNITLRTAGASLPGFIEYDGDASVVVVALPVR